jgi:hypothetical protein
MDLQQWAVCIFPVGEMKGLTLKSMEVLEEDVIEVTVALPIVIDLAVVEDQVLVQDRVHLEMEKNE